MSSTSTGQSKAEAKMCIRDRYYGATRVGSLGKINLGWMRKNTAIIHYCGANKPWNPLYLGEVGIFYKEVAQKKMCIRDRSYAQGRKM